MIYENSRYLHTPVYNRLKDVNAVLLKRRDRFKFDVSKATMYEWKDTDRLDKLAVQFYGKSSLRWAILDANTDYRTEYDIQPGDRIVIPSYEEVVKIVNV